MEFAAENVKKTFTVVAGRFGKTPKEMIRSKMNRFLMSGLMMIDVNEKGNPLDICKYVCASMYVHVYLNARINVRMYVII